MILVGTSGYSYDDWRGAFYPPGLPKGEMLTYYAQHFAAVELNFTYYRMPTERTLASIARKAKGRLTFAVKAHADLTHQREPRPGAGREFMAGCRPLLETGALGCVLAQFPWSFKVNADGLKALEMVQTELAGVPLVVEFRNSGWIVPEVRSFLQEKRIGFCCVDAPRLKGLPPPVAWVTGSVGYVRFHGRNAEQWWHHEQAWERYNYLYRREELDPWIPKLKEIAGHSERTFVFTNNHYRGNAVTNAKMLLEMLEESNDRA